MTASPSFSHIVVNTAALFAMRDVPEPDKALRRIVVACDAPYRGADVN
jgi:hypothetical protein